MNRNFLAAVSLAGLFGFGTIATAQMPGDAGHVEARLIAKDPESRIITVRLEGDNSIRTFRISEDASLVKTFDNLRRPIRIEDLNIGNEVMLELGSGNPSVN